ncbi:MULTISPECIES: hypothetical protein [Paenibacillus]|uniref:hypothetical protein n=1 Tax=Paenibacillus TaxID=44249 RepID=UPI00020D7A3A|nr:MULTISPECIES: hypothetical protein [Paenibacillus]EGL17877.1 hypothetical protein HMPREF9413_4197 [Paenibacillus sp. HGF7]EPD81632.1 hypothetical protein HMPREF1207_05390 [Paenibacillus sp. HGH0039]MBV6715402.1 hypothetical protein [Paenibacillus chitinolyticus]
MKDREGIKRKRIWSFILSKLAAAGTLFTIFVIIALADDAGLYQISEAARFPYLWWLVYGYAVMYSILVELILFKFFPQAKVGVRMIVYGAGGFAPFAVFFFNTLYIAIPGLIGSVCALFFYAADSLYRRTKIMSAVAGLCIPAVLLVFAGGDFTETKQWREIRTHSSYEVSFAYFNGEKAVPVPIKQGETALLTYSWTMKNGGYGVRFTDVKQVPGDPPGDNKIRIRAPESGISTLILTGDHAEGTFRVEWTVE